MPRDEDIPDLFPAVPGAASRSSSRREAAPHPGGNERVQVERALARRPDGVSSFPPSGAFRDSEPRPSRPVPGPDSGLELESIDEAPILEEKATMVVGTSDELEFDPTSIPPPDFTGAGTEAVKFSARENVAPLLDLGSAPESPLSRASRSWRPPSGRPPRADASGVATSSPSLRVPSLNVPSLDVPSLDVPSHQSKSDILPETEAKKAAVASKHAFSNAGFAAFPGMGNEVDLGDGLDDLDFGNAAAAQLNVGLPEREEGDDVRWPLGRTPEGDELAVNASEAQQVSGFGPPPRAFLGTPLYTLRVYRALGPLRGKEREAEKLLREVEAARDEMLAELATEQRGELQTSDRFASLYAQIAKHEQNIKLKKRDLEMADVEGAQALRNAQASIDTLNAERLVKARARDEKRVVMEEAERTMKRYQAALRRIQIEWRNIEARAAKSAGREMPAELDAALDVLEQQQVRAKADLDDSIKQLREVKKQLGEAEDDVRVAVAHVEAAEGKKEGLLIASEGEIAERSRTLDRVLFERLEALAEAGRAIIDLRGQVPVKPSVRSNLLAADERVVAAARHLALVRMAAGSMDRDAYGTGRAVWIAGLLVFLALLVLSALSST